MKTVENRKRNSKTLSRDSVRVVVPNTNVLQENDSVAASVTVPKCEQQEKDSVTFSGSSQLRHNDSDSIAVGGEVEYNSSDPTAVRVEEDDDSSGALVVTRRISFSDYREMKELKAKMKRCRHQ